MTGALSKSLSAILPAALSDPLNGALTTARDRVRERRAFRRFRRRVDTGTAEPAADAPRHVICVVVDAFRAVAVTDETAPFLAGLDGGEAISPSTWTFPAVTSLLTGQYLHNHGVMRESDTFEVSVLDMTGLPEPAEGAVRFPSSKTPSGSEGR